MKKKKQLNNVYAFKDNPSKNKKAWCKVYLDRPDNYGTCHPDAPSLNMLYNKSLYTHNQIFIRK